MYDTVCGVACIDFPNRKSIEKEFYRWWDAKMSLDRVSQGQQDRRDSVGFIRNFPLWFGGEQQAFWNIKFTITEYCNKQKAAVFIENYKTGCFFAVINRNLYQIRIQVQMIFVYALHAYSKSGTINYTHYEQGEDIE